MERKTLLETEKELTRRMDGVKAQLRRLPMVKIDISTLKRVYEDEQRTIICGARSWPFVRRAETSIRNPGSGAAPGESALRGEAIRGIADAIEHVPEF